MALDLSSSNDEIKEVKDIFLNLINPQQIQPNILETFILGTNQTKVPYYSTHSTFRAPIFEKFAVPYVTLQIGVQDSGMLELYAKDVVVTIS